MKLQGDKTDFFKKRNIGGSESSSFSAETEAEKASSENELAQNGSANAVASSSVAVSSEFKKKLGIIGSVFSELDLKRASKELVNIMAQTTRERFTVAVVGEFSRGKSYFINNFLGRELLPVDNLPSTAILTRIRYNPKEVMVYIDGNGNKARTCPADNISWDGLTAENFGGKDAEGFSVIGLNDPWLKQSGVELIDTPGAGDLEESRVRVTGEALNSCDGAIIAISAECALSMSEKLFIEQRLLAKKTPYLMLVVTKLDRVPLNERNMVVDFIKKRLKQWNMEIPVYLPYDVEMPDDKYSDIMGLGKIKEIICSWVNDPGRIALTENWIRARINSVIAEEVASLNEQLLLLQADDEKKRELISQKESRLSLAEQKWEELKAEFSGKCRECYGEFTAAIQGKQWDIIERLQYEANHAAEPARWWKEDYPYRLKVELTNLSVYVENIVSKKINDDVRWLNSNLESVFKTHVLYDKGVIISKDDLSGGAIADGQFKDMTKTRNAVKIGTTIATLGVAAVMAATGGMVLVATMGVGTGAGILSEKFFKKKIDEQRTHLKSLIAQNVPEVIASATSESEARILNIYEEVNASATQKEIRWLETQKDAIRGSVGGNSDEKQAKVNAILEKLNSVASSFQIESAEEII